MPVIGRQPHKISMRVIVRCIDGATDRTLQISDVLVTIELAMIENFTMNKVHFLEREKVDLIKIVGKRKGRHQAR